MNTCEIQQYKIIDGAMGIITKVKDKTTYAILIKK